MSETDSTATTAKEPKEKEPKEKESMFPSERLIEEASAFFGAPSYEIAGALQGQKKTNFTRSEVEKLHEAWLSRPVTGEEG